MAPNEPTPPLGTDAISSRARRPAASERLVLSIGEVAEALGVSDDLVYELTERGEPPFLRLGRRKVVPRRAIELVVEAALSDDGAESDAGSEQRGGHEVTEVVQSHVVQAKDCDEGDGTSD